MAYKREPQSSSDWLILKSINQAGEQQRLIPAVTECIVCALKYLNRQPQSEQNMRPKNKTKKTTKKKPEKSRLHFLMRVFLGGDFLMLINAFLSFFIHLFFFKVLCFVSGENDLEAKYRRSILDIAILQDHIGEQHFYVPSCNVGFV